MKRLFLALLFFPIFSWAAEQTDFPSTTNALPQLQSCQDGKSLNPAVTDSREQIARSGCCSHHQGVCGCSGGRQVCCDGSYSPSCTCHKEEPPVVQN